MSVSPPRGETNEKISVIICTRDRPDTIEQAIASVVACDHPDFDIHVMDQSTDDQTRRIVEALAAPLPDGKLVYHHLDKAGLSRAYNAGMRVSDGPIIACTDDDVIVPTDWLARIGAAFAADPDAGLLYGQVLVPSSLEDKTRGEIVVPALVWDAPERLFYKDRNFKVWGMGANMAIRRRMLDDVVGFDEAMGGGAPLRSSQDFDFAYRVYRAKYAVVLDPSVTVDHYGTRTRDQWSSTERNYAIGNGAFFGKHIRCGDLLAMRLFARHVGRLAGRMAYHSVRDRRFVGVGVYERSLVTGLRESSRFAVDRSTRLYRETATAKIEVTEANAVTGAHR
jgi:glycosyltransferase involved in cell wall biosynthesis